MLANNFAKFITSTIIVSLFVGSDKKHLTSSVRALKPALTQHPIGFGLFFTAVYPSVELNTILILFLL